MSDHEPHKPFGNWVCLGGPYRCLALEVRTTRRRVSFSLTCHAYILSCISEDEVVFKNAVRIIESHGSGFSHPDDVVVYDVMDLLREAGAGQILSGTRQFQTLPLVRVEEVLRPHIRFQTSSGAEPKVRVRDCRIGFVRRAHLIMQMGSTTGVSGDQEAELRTLVDALDRVRVDL